MPTLQENKSRRHQLLSNASTLLQAGLDTSEKRNEYTRLISDADLIEKDIIAQEKIERSLPKSEPNAVSPPATQTRVQNNDSPEERRKRLNVAFRSLLRNGYNPQIAEQRDLTEDDGSVAVPTEFESTFTQAMKMYGPISTLVKQVNEQNGRPRKFVIADDTSATMKYVAETGATSGVEADPTLRSQIPGTDALVTVVKYSLQELEDAENLDVFLRDIAGLRVARAVEHALTLGTDASNTALPNSPTGGLLAAISAGVTQTSGQLAAGPTYAQLAALAGSIDHAYYANGAFMASPSVFNFLLTQVDSTGKQLYAIDPNSGLMVIAGKPLYVNNAMPVYNAASSPVVLFGDYSRAYAYLNGGGTRIRVLTERYMDQFSAAAVVYHRLGSAALVSGAVKSLVTAAS